MKTAGCLRVVLPTYQTTRRHIPECHNIDIHLYVNLNSHSQRMSCIRKSTNVKFMCHIDEIYVTNGGFTIWSNQSFRFSITVRQFDRWVMLLVQITVLNNFWSNFCVPCDGHQLRRTESVFETCFVWDVKPCCLVEAYLDVSEDTTTSIFREVWTSWRFHGDLTALRRFSKKSLKVWFEFIPTSLCSCCDCCLTDLSIWSDY